MLNGLEAFLHMGGYGAYVWSSYGLASLVLIVNVVLPLRAERAALLHIASREALGEPHDTPS